MGGFCASYNRSPTDASWSRFFWILQGSFKDVEDKKHRAVYERLADSDQKLQYFSARQIGCRLLGCRGYLCQKVLWCPTQQCKRLSVVKLSVCL